MSTQITATGGEGEPRRTPPAGGGSSSGSGGFFSLYKSGQGYWTRLGTAIGAAAIILFVGWFVFSETSIFRSLAPAGRRYAIAAAVVGALSLLAWWLMNAPKRAQFIIDTDSEMKKVNWASWPELIGSTRIVIGFMLLTALTLFIFDVQFQALFHSLGVWHIAFNPAAGAATGFLASVVMIAVGAALLRGTREGESHKISGSITLVLGVAALVAWIMFTIKTIGAPDA